MNYQMTDLELVEASCIKWLGIVNRQIEDEGVLNCALCQKYFRQECKDCPIATYTGQECCHDTPYDEWITFTEEVPIVEVPDDLLLVAYEEFEFLMSLREEIINAS